MDAAQFGTRGRLEPGLGSRDRGAGGRNEPVGRAGDARPGHWRGPEEWTRRNSERVAAWNQAWEAATAAPAAGTTPSDAQVIGALARKASERAVVVCAAGGLPGELHKLWRVRGRGGYHL